MKRAARRINGLTKSLEKKSLFVMVLLGIVPLVIFGIVALASTESIETIGVVFAAVTGVSTAMVFFFGVQFERRVAAPIRRINETLRLYLNGQPIPKDRLLMKSGDEIGEMSELIDRLLELREDTTLQRTLEQRLNEQNRELQEAMEMLKSTQLRMIQQERLAAIGQLAAGVAHEINNPLGYVSGNADMLRLYVQRYETILAETRRLMQEKPDDPCYAQIDRKWRESKIDMVIADMPDLLSDITEGLKRIAAIVNGLRGFSRNNLDGICAYDLNDGIHTTLLVANNELKYHCDVDLKLGDIPLISVNGGQINQVLLNVIINAAHAIREKHANKKGLITIMTYTEDDKVVCSVSDNGCGMSEEVKNRIFEPFFTTKPVGQGTGLGLGIVYDIICKQHEGGVDVRSTPGEGTSFVFSLPIKRGAE